ncbi:MAG TPA: universal stress protein [Candidatus Kryptobacter bacterium]|nr:MAG: stress protein UspA [Ignavibacteriae bacterium 37-53-5]HQT90784.1 universal stress protein [Candidatus Kryptobacter bacterium]
MPTVSLKKILVPQDFSEYSLHALKYAVTFAELFKSELIILHIVEPIVYPADFSFGQVSIPAMEEEIRKHSEEQLNELVEREIPAGIKATPMIRVGKPFIEIVEVAKGENADLIVISSHGRTGMDHVLFGSTADKVVRKAPCPVLTIRPHEHEFVLP